MTRNEREYFVTWSEHFGYDITTDDPHMMVSHYQDIYGNTIQETEEELADISDDALVYTGISGNFCVCFLFSMRYSMITTTKNKGYMEISFKGPVAD